MAFNIKKNFFIIILFFFILIFHQLVFQKFFSNPNGFVGHDYEQFIPNFMFGKIWFKNNFLSIPWFTPSNCCGIPFFADPQSMFYSIPQIIFLIFNPITSIKVVFLIFSLFGYIGMFLLIKKSFKFDNYISLLCASLFLFNGFFVYRAISGHVAYLSYIFVPLYCFFLIQSFENKFKKSNYIYLLLSSIIFANFFHSGSGPIILIIFTSIFSVILIYSHLINNFKIFFSFFYSIFLGILISLSKIVASLFFLKNFPRQYPATEFSSFYSFVKEFFSSFFLKANQNSFNENLSSMFPFGLHEMEFSVSIVPIILLLFIFFLRTECFKLKYNNTRFLFFVFFIFLIPVLFNVNFLNQYQLIAKIPILNSTWVQFRWMLVYIIPLIIISGLILKNLKISLKNKNYLSVTLIFILLIQNLIKDDSWHYNDQRYNMKNSIDFYAKLDKGFAPEIKGPAVLLEKSGKPKKVSNKNDMMFFSYSPLICYQPIFGYGLERLNGKQITFNSKKNLKDESMFLYSNKLDRTGDNFMLFNPSCFLFPKENNCLPGDTFKISNKDNLILFSKYKSFKFKKNKIQTFSNYVSFITFVVSLLFLVYSLILWIFRKIKT
jgi:hypothetical protein